MPDLDQHMEKVIPPRPAPAPVAPKPTETTPPPQFVKKNHNLPLLIGLAISILLNVILLILFFMMK